MTTQELKNLIREDLEQDQYNQLIGFCTVEDHPDTCQLGKTKVALNHNDTIVLWRDSNGDLRVDEIGQFHKDHIDV